jgi:threonyl-tRNA synthetase
MRVRAFTQDDAHIFCTEDQIQEEVSGFIELLSSVYLDFGFPEVDVKLSTRPLKRVGSDETWDKAETALQRALDARQMNWQLQPGEGAFYGPKIEFALRDSLGRSWQCGTIQLDFSLPVRLGACYVAEDNVRKAPVMLHRAILGSMERFIGILLEHYAGQLPVWLSPVQAVVMSITERFVEYAAIVAESLENQGFRAIADLRNEKIGLKIREHSLHKIPYLLVIGEREVEQRTVAVRAQNGTDLGSKTLAELCALLTEQVIHRARPN